MRLHECGIFEAIENSTLVRLPVHASVCDCAPLRQFLQDCDPEDKAYDWLRHLPAHIGVHELVGRSCLATEGFSAFKQLAWQVGLGIEIQLWSEGKAMATSSSSVSPHAFRWASGSGITDHQRSRLCVRYWLSSRAACKDAQVLSFGIDASRVGFKGRQNIAFVLPNNIGVWAPPQVAR